MVAARKTTPGVRRAKTLKRRAPKTCARCDRSFVPTGANQKRCAGCIRPHELEVLRERWHRTYVKKGRDQRGERNNNWRGGTAPATYREICFAVHGDRCFRCGGQATLVHHVDEDRSNNVPENLRPMCKRCHQLEHGCTRNLPKPGTLAPKKCIDCNELYSPGSGRSLRCSACKREHLRDVAREKSARKRLAVRAA